MSFLPASMFLDSVNPKRKGGKRLSYNQRRENFNFSGTKTGKIHELLLSNGIEETP